MKALTHELKLQLRLLAAFVALLWALEIVDVFVGGSLDKLGIRPRSMTGLPGILVAPLLHRGFAHLAANTVPLAVLAWMVMVRRTSDIVTVSLAATLVGGAGIWLFGGSDTVHIGASILVFGYFGYLLLRGWFERSVTSILGSIVVAALYGGLIVGVLPGTAGVSWEGHLFGFIGGVLAARALARDG